MKLNAHGADVQVSDRIAENFDSMRQNAVCIICHDLKNVPVGLPCGHSFCSNCIHPWLLSKKDVAPSCPTCRAVCTVPPVPQPEYQNMIDVMFAKQVS